MKKVNKFYVLAFLISGWIGTNAQAIEAEVPGDNFSLEGALELFKKSASPEEFERLLNSSDSRVNNLDLNGDGRVDYVRVIDRNEGNVHIFIIQAVLSRTESQDVAVIELEKLANGKAVLQITGDADVYGMETIIEPTSEVRVNAGTTTVHTVVNVWSWPAVQYVYGPYYSVWISPWTWAYHPFWWQPWRPVAYYVYDPWWQPYRHYYAVCYSHRIGYLPQYYSPYRSTSVIVYNNYHHQINHYRSTHRGHDRHAGRIITGRDRHHYDNRTPHGRDRYESRSVNGRNHYVDKPSNGRDRYETRNGNGGNHYDDKTSNGRDREERKNVNGNDRSERGKFDNRSVDRGYQANTSSSRYQPNSMEGTLKSSRENHSQNKLNTNRHISTQEGNDRKPFTSDFKSAPHSKPESRGALQRDVPQRLNSHPVQRPESRQSINGGNRHQEYSKSHSGGGYSNESPRHSGGVPSGTSPKHTGGKKK